MTSSSNITAYNNGLGGNVFAQYGTADSKYTVVDGGFSGTSLRSDFGACVTDTPTISPSRPPTPAPSTSPTPQPTVSPTKAPSTSPTTDKPTLLLDDADTNEPTSSPIGQCMEFDSMDAVTLVRTVLQDPQGQIQFDNIEASGHDCFKRFANGHAMGQNVLTGEDLIPESGVIMSSGDPEDFCWNDSDQNSGNFLEGGDTHLTAVVQQESRYSQTFDACVIEFDFKCDEAGMVSAPEFSFRYVWGSEEYYEYVSSAFNDAFAFFLNGENIAKLPDGVTDVSINNVNHYTNEEFFIGNDVSEWPGIQYPKIEADGFTTHLTARGYPKETQEWNHIKLVCECMKFSPSTSLHSSTYIILCILLALLAVADTADHILDSYVLLEAGSFSCVDNTQAPSMSSAPTTSSAPTDIHSDAPSESVAPTASPSSSPSCSKEVDFDICFGET